MCTWQVPGGNLTVLVSVYQAAAEVRQFFSTQVAASGRETTGSGVRTQTFGKRPVTGLGDQATALLQTVTVLSAGKNSGVSDWVQLFVRSGNAEAEIGYNLPIPSAAQLPGAIAIARGVLARLPRP